MQNILIPIAPDSKEIAALEMSLSRVPAFGNVDQFLMLYNSSLLNPKSEEVIKVVKLISEAYSNIVKVGSRFVVKSAAEDALTKAQFLLSKAALPASLKRIAVTMLEEDYGPNDKMIFLGSEPGVLYIETAEGRVAYDGAERLFKSKEDLASNPYLEQYIYDYTENNDSGDDCCLVLSEVANIDDSFIVEIGKLLKITT